ncbi:glutamate racemase [Candidatus Nucleicultrix amoebiphila]|jgi:glutamate racemase|uniref:glutamate racemase n=1 Tax=Candidatus Nucleicultrix amoebiphila TaxID=1509244 RepID=UPI000A26FE07|nr:glutamate racemase [Candidatus Nucleicultrix amoebiphila]
MNRPIGVIDSGIGGLTVLKKLQAYLPYENFIYFADTAHLPYGNKTPQQIFSYVKAILTWMEEQSVKLVVMACNTSSALILHDMQKIFQFPIVGLITPTTEIHALRNKRFGLMATEATVKSGAYENAFKRINPKVTFHSVACPALVPLIEENRIEEEAMKVAVQSYVQILLDKGIDALIYGCTHYPYLSSIIRDMLPQEVEILDPADAVFKVVDEKLQYHTLKRSACVNAHIHFYTSSHPQKFSEAASRYLARSIQANQIRPENIMVQGDPLIFPQTCFSSM